MVTSGFFNSLNGDRKYNAEQLSAIFDGLVNDGVYASIGTAFSVKANGGNSVTIGIGRGWFRHTWILNDSILPITADVSELLVDRYDAVVIEVNHNDSVREAYFKIVKGTPSSDPQRPTLSKSNGVYQYPLAYIYRKGGSEEITQANITNMVGTSSCPYVTGIIQVQNIDNIVAQWSAQWDEWSTAKTDEMNNWSEAEKADFEAWRTAQETTMTNWTNAEKSNWTTWRNSLESEMTTWTSGKKNEWNAWFDSVEAETNQWTDEKKAAFDAWFADIRTVVSTEVITAITDRILKLEDGTTPAGKAKTLTEVLPISLGGTGASTVEDSFSALSKTRCNESWKNSKSGISTFFYEGADANTYDIPNGNCVVLTIINSVNRRGTAIALGWTRNNITMWRNTLHDDTGSNEWSGWKVLTNDISSANALINALNTGSDIPVDNDYFISQYVNGGESNTQYYRRPMSKLWEYIKTKANGVVDADTVDGYHASDLAKARYHGVVADTPYMEKVSSTTPNQITRLQLEDDLVILYVSLDNGKTWTPHRVFTVSGGSINGDVTFNGHVSLVGGSNGSNEGGELIFAKSSNFGGNITMDIYDNSVRFFASHNGVLKTYAIDFATLKGDDKAIHSSNFAQYAVPLTGGTIRNDDNSVPFGIANTLNAVFMGLHTNAGYIGGYGAQDYDAPLWYNASDGSYNRILYQNNAHEYAFRRYTLNTINIDNTDGNWSTDVSTDDYGTRPTSGWCHIIQTEGDHFYAQIGHEINSSPTGGNQLYIRMKYQYTGTWSDWVKLFDTRGGTIAGNVTFNGDVLITKNRLKVSNGHGHVYADGNLIALGACNPADNETTARWLRVWSKVKNNSIESALGFVDGQTEYKVLHAGNSAPVKIQSSAPADTSALWVW